MLYTPGISSGEFCLGWSSAMRCTQMEMVQAQKEPNRSTKAFDFPIIPLPFRSTGHGHPWEIQLWRNNTAGKEEIVRNDSRGHDEGDFAGSPLVLTEEDIILTGTLI